MIYYAPKMAGNIGDAIMLHGLIKTLGPGEIVTYGAPVPPTDCVCVAGSPWIWDLCNESRKYADLRRVLAAVPDATRIAYGVGSCYPQGAVFGGAPQQDLSLWLSFERVVTRDRLAHHLFMRAGVKSELKPCPSIHAHEGEQLDYSESRDVFVAYDALAGLSKGALRPEFRERWKRINRRRLRELENPLVLGVTKGDCAWAKKVLGVEAEWIGQAEPDYRPESVRRVLRILAQARRVVTGRIHIGMPALAMGKDVLFLGVDSRVMTAEFAGGKTLWCDEWREP